MAQPLTDVEEYDQFGTPPTTQQDCDFLVDLMRRQNAGSPRLLDLACGTGRHAVEMAKRGYDVTGVDISEERLQDAQSQATKLGFTNCRFLKADLRDLRLEPSFGYAYSFFNTFSLFVDNDDLLTILGKCRSCLTEGGRIVIEVGSLWCPIADGKFHNDSYEQKHDRGTLIRTVKGTLRLARANNVYRHDRVIQYRRDGVDYPPEDAPATQRIYSINEWDLLGRLTGMRIEHVFGAMDITHEITDPNSCDGKPGDHELVLVLARQGE
ncbi:MAG: class I SAM-dependent methyltransferase [Candidatus Coatesbacteria bacterium]